LKTLMCFQCGKEGRFPLGTESYYQRLNYLFRFYFHYIPPVNLSCGTWCATSYHRRQRRPGRPAPAQYATPCHGAPHTRLSPDSDQLRHGGGIFSVPVPATGSRMCDLVLPPTAQPGLPGIGAERHPMPPSITYSAVARLGPTTPWRRHFFCTGPSYRLPSYSIYTVRFFFSVFLNLKFVMCFF